MAFVDLLQNERHMKPSLQHGHNFSMLPPPPPSFPTSLCYLCYLPFNPAINATCPNCCHRSPLLSPSSPSPSPLQQHHLNRTKRSNSSLSSSGSSSSSVTSPSDLPNNSFVMSSMLGVVDDILREDIPQGLPACRHCRQAEMSLLFCLDCNEHICLQCTPYHQKGHQIVKTHPSFPYRQSPISPPPSQCDTHLGEPLQYFCKPCLALLCSKCIAEHKGHQCRGIAESYQEVQASLDKFAPSVSEQLLNLDHSAQDIERLHASVLQKKREVVSSVQMVFHQLHESIKKRELEILNSIDSITNMRLDSINKERDRIASEIRTITDLSRQMREGGQSPSLILAYCKLEKELEKLSSNPKRQTVEDESLLLVQNQSNLQMAISDYCAVTTSPYPPLCTVTGEGLLTPQAHQPLSLTLYTKDRAGKPCLEGGELVTASLRQKGGGEGTVTKKDNRDGTHILSFKPCSPGEHQLAVTIRGHHIQGSPFKLSVNGGREYTRSSGSVSIVFGSEGSKPGQFCRPWGICSDQKGNIIVGDRSNHRIQVFNSKGEFSHAFGSEGSRPGQFNRPAGVAATREGDIVIADKDNHRIQKFKLNGKLVQCFGSRGSSDSQMVYPYDVSVHQNDGRIAVTDTGNHRILIFTHDGLLLGKFGYKGYLCGHFDSPRGIAINNNGHVVVSDFNTHHVLVIDPNGTTAHILGSHGNGNAQFTRPQGIAIDHMGNIIVADTKNNRVVIINPCGHFVTKMGSAGTSHGQFDRPTSVTVLPDGRIAVLDFGNSRVQVF